MIRGWLGLFVGIAIGLTGCSAHGHVEPSDIGGTAVSVDEILRGTHEFSGKSVPVRGYVCWSPEYESIYGIFDSADGCKNGRYIRAIELLSEDLPNALPGQSSIAFVTLLGIYKGCANCVSTGPIDNGYIQVTELRIEPSRR